MYDISEGGVREYNTKIVMGQEKDIFFDSQNVGTLNEEIPNFRTEMPSVVYVDGVQVQDTNVYLTSIPQYTYTKQEFTYKINHGFIYTGFKEGNIESAYKAFPVDNDGSPMIEDSAKVIRFVVAYIKKVVAEKMWIMDEMTTEKKRYFDQEYSFAAASARSDASPVLS